MEKVISREIVNNHSLEPLSQREFSILMDMSNGLTNDQIANKQYLSLNTVKWHTSNIYSKIGAKNRTAAAKFINELK